LSAKPWKKIELNQLNLCSMLHKCVALSMLHLAFGYLGK